MPLISGNPVSAVQQVSSKMMPAKCSSLHVIYCSAYAYRYRVYYALSFQALSPRIISIVLAANGELICSKLLLFFPAIAFYYFHYLYCICISRRPFFGQLFTLQFTILFSTSIYCWIMPKTTYIEWCSGSYFKSHEIPGFLSARCKLHIILGQTSFTSRAWAKYTNTVKMYSFVLYFKTIFQKQFISIAWQFDLHFWKHLDDRLQLECSSAFSNPWENAEMSKHRHDFKFNHLSRLELHAPEKVNLPIPLSTGNFKHTHVQAIWSVSTFASQKQQAPASESGYSRWAWPLHWPKTSAVTTLQPCVSISSPLGNTVHPKQFTEGFTGQHLQPHWHEAAGIDLVT